MLLDAEYTARLADFGYASLVGNIPEALTYLQRSTARPGALRWITPEQIESDEPFNQSPKCDIYSFGCVALQVGSLDSVTGFMLIFLFFRFCPENNHGRKFRERQSSCGT